MVVPNQVRLEGSVSARTRLTFVTPGVLLRQLIVDPALEDVTHVFIDEVHERNVNTGEAVSAPAQPGCRASRIRLLHQGIAGCGTQQAAHFPLSFLALSRISISL